MSVTDRPSPTLETGDRTPLFIYALYIAGVVVPLTAVVGVIWAYVVRGEAEPMHRSHYTWQIRTFWIALAAAVLSMLLAVIGIGILLSLALIVWLLARSIKGLVAFNKGRPIDNPQSWLI